MKWIKYWTTLTILLTYDFALSQCKEGNCEDGYGIYVYGGGDKYEGNFLGGDRHGWGCYLYSDGDLYCGNWKDDDKYYYGSKFWNSNGETDFYLGLYKDDRQNQGLYVYEDGTPKYEVEDTHYSNLLLSKGCIEGNCEDGYGIYVYSGGDKYEGNFLGGDRHGWGCYLYSDGDLYCGNWKDDDKYYYGSKFWNSNGETDFYLGLYKDDRQNQGLYVYEDGTPKYEVERTFYLEEQPYPTLNQGKIHLFISVASEDRTLGSGSLGAKKTLLKEFKKISRHTGLEITPYIIEGTAFNKTSLNTKINALKCSRHDVIFFYNLGHGFRYSDQLDPYPYLFLGENGDVDKYLLDLIVLRDYLFQ